jgi:hypothetical protein
MAKKESTFAVTPEMSRLDIKERPDLDRLCHFEADPGANLYLFLKQRDPGAGIQFVCADPHRRSPARSSSGPLCCWYPKARVAKLKQDYLAGGHPDSFEAEALKWRGYGKEFRAFLHVYYKRVEEIQKEEKQQKANQMHLHLVEDD